MNNKAIIVDLDGTLIDNNKRAAANYSPMPKNCKNPAKYWEPFFEESVSDHPNYWCLDIVEAMAKNNYHIIFLTARSATPKTIAATKRWLGANVDESVKYVLLMRPENDKRPDYVVKRDITVSKIIPNYFVVFAIDDKRSNVEMFDRLSIKCLHSADY
jgi:predicted secreted acid phosphatase